MWKQPWTVHVQQIGTGEHALLYLSRYVYRVALTNHCIEHFEQDRVTFRYTHARTGDTRRVTLPVEAFLARFLQHVLPRGFAKIRSYGLLSPSRKAGLERARHLLDLHSAAAANTGDRRDPNAATHQLDDSSNVSVATASTLSALRCTVCDRGTLTLVERLRRSRAPP